MKNEKCSWELVNAPCHQTTVQTFEGAVPSPVGRAESGILHRLLGLNNVYNITYIYIWVLSESPSARKAHGEHKEPQYVHIGKRFCWMSESRRGLSSRRARLLFKIKYNNIYIWVYMHFSGLSFHATISGHVQPPVGFSDALHCFRKGNPCTIQIGTQERINSRREPRDVTASIEKNFTWNLLTAINSSSREVTDIFLGLGIYQTKKNDSLTVLQY